MHIINHYVQHKAHVAVCHSGNALALINVVALRPARLLFGCVTVYGYTILVFNQATQVYSTASA